MDSTHEKESSLDWMPQRFSMKGVSHQLVLIGKDRLTATFRGVGQHANDVGAVRADRPVPLTLKVYYYEVTIINEGEKGKIGIGFAGGDFKLQRQPGWEPNSYGFHGDDGRKFFSSTNGTDYGPKFVTGDVVGAGFNLQDQQMFFTKNGKYLGLAFDGVLGTLYPTIGLHSKSESIEVNFGQKPFVFDIEGMLQEDKERVQNEIKGSIIPPTLVDNIVRRYLYHYGYSSTLSAFDEFCVVEGSYKNLLHEKDIRELDFRRNLRQKVLQGQIDEVLSLLKNHCPDILTSQDPSFRDVVFTLGCQKFIELVRQHQVETAVQFAQEELCAFRSVSDSYSKQLHQIIALVAYTQPEDASLMYLFSKERRDYAADVVNAALLRVSTSQHAETIIQGQEAMTAVEKILKQLVSTQKQLHEENKNQGEVFRLEDHLFE